MHQIGPKVFILSGFISLAFITLFILVLFLFIRDRFKESKKLILFLILGIFTLVNFLYFTNLIPPIPLSLKDGGMYHSIEKDVNGNYAVTYEDYGWRGYFQMYPNFQEAPDSPVYAYSAVFSPTNLNITIVHEWQYYDETQGQWVTKTTIDLPVVGGRGGGFRTYSELSNLASGHWRVNIMTTEGQIIGRLRFNIVPVFTEPSFSYDIKS
jgi:hypothetical protein